MARKKKKEKETPMHFHNMLNEMGRAFRDTALHQIEPV